MDLPWYKNSRLRARGKTLGSVEILIETNNRSWELQLFMLPPSPLGHPPIGITPDRVEKYHEKKRGSGGCSPWAASPSGGERGSFSKLPKSINEQRQKRISTEQKVVEISDNHTTPVIQNPLVYQ